VASSNTPQSPSREAGTGGRGAILPTSKVVQDQYSEYDILQGESVIVIYPYEAAKCDEHTLRSEDRISISQIYDDGGALGTEQTRGEEGAFPLVCFTSAKGDNPMARRHDTSGSRVTGTDGTDGTDGGVGSGNDAFDAEEAVNADDGLNTALSKISIISTNQTPEEEQSNTQEAVNRIDPIDLPLETFTQVISHLLPHEIARSSFISIDWKISINSNLTLHRIVDLRHLGLGSKVEEMIQLFSRLSSLSQNRLEEVMLNLSCFWEDFQASQGERKDWKES